MICCDSGQIVQIVNNPPTDLKHISHYLITLEQLTAHSCEHAVPPNACSGGSVCFMAVTNSDIPFYAARPPSQVVNGCMPTAFPETTVIMEAGRK